MARPPLMQPTRSALTTARLRRGLTLKGLSEASGISLPFIGLVEVGQRSASTATWLALARALDVHISQIRPVAEEDARQSALFPDLYLEVAGDEHEPT